MNLYHGSPLVQHVVVTINISQYAQVYHSFSEIHKTFIVMYKYWRLACNFGAVFKYSWVKYIRIVSKEMKLGYYGKQRKKRKGQSSLDLP